jgi:hypothetical protein
MAYDWETIAKHVGDITPEGEQGSGTDSGRRALELLLGEEDIRSSVDYCVSMKPGWFTAEMVLKIIRSEVAMERCYEVYKANAGTKSSNIAVGLLSTIADVHALQWVREFLDDSSVNIRWHGLLVLRCILYGPLGDSSASLALELLQKAESDSDPAIKERALQIRKECELDRSAGK